MSGRNFDPVGRDRLALAAGTESVVEQVFESRRDHIA